MRKLVWFTLGVAFGFACAHVIEGTSRGHAAFGRVNACIDAFVARAGDAFRDTGGVVDAR